MNQQPQGPYNTNTGFPDVRGHIISILNSSDRNQPFPFELPQYVEPNIHIQPPPSFRNWFGSVSQESYYSQPKQETSMRNAHHYSPTIQQQQQHQHMQSPIQTQPQMVSHMHYMEDKKDMKLRTSPVNQIHSASVLGKRSKSEMGTENVPKKKELVFKGFTMEPDSKRIKFVNSDRKVDGINDGPWTDQEHEDFLLGLQECGSGKWRDIAEKFVKTRTRVQVASHAQKYFSKLKRREKKAAEAKTKQEQ
jgi:SHAQKYF class myb-like DNA-binding protein